MIVAETAPSYQGHDMARALSAAGISTFLVPDLSIFAILSRVNKLILGAHAILANGGMVAVAGALLAATAARAHSTPVVVCAGQFKLTALWNLYHVCRPPDGLVEWRVDYAVSVFWVSLLDRFCL